MTHESYGQFCPVAMAAEMLCTRWTIVVIREMVAGSTRFGDLRRGVPRMSATLLSQRLKDLEAAGIVSRISMPDQDGIFEYRLTEAGLDPTPLPPSRTVVQFRYPVLPLGKRNWWLIVEPSADVDLCSTDPGLDVDLWVTTDLKTMTSIWMGLIRVEDARSKITFDGNKAIARTMQNWLGLSPFAAQAKLVN